MSIRSHLLHCLPSRPLLPGLPLHRVPKIVHSSYHLCAQTFKGFSFYSQNQTQSLCHDLSAPEGSTRSVSGCPFRLISSCPCPSSSTVSTLDFRHSSHSVLLPQNLEPCFPLHLDCSSVSTWLVPSLYSGLCSSTPPLRGLGSWPYVECHPEPPTIWWVAPYEMAIFVGQKW